MRMMFSNLYNQNPEKGCGNNNPHLNEKILYLFLGDRCL